MCRVCSSDFIAVQQCHVTLCATDAMVPAWQVPPGLQNLPQEKSWGYFMVSRDHRNTGTTDCLCWVFSATSTVGFFLLQGHTDTKWPSLHLWNFSHTQSISAVFPSLPWTERTFTSQTVFSEPYLALWALSYCHLLTLPFLKCFKNCTLLHWGPSIAELKGILTSHFLQEWDVSFF